MKTRSLIQMLATHAEPVPAHGMARYLSLSLLSGLLASVVLSIMLIGILPVAMFTLPVVWVKFVYGLALAAVLVVLLWRLCHPGAPTRQPRAVLLGVFTVILVIGAIHLLMTPDSLRLQAVFGQTWIMCPFFVLGLSLPAMAGLMAAARQLAPTDLKATGFAVGLLAGALGALGYSLACPETSLTFVAIWYMAGILLSGLLGLALGARVLRW